MKTLWLPINRPKSSSSRFALSVVTGLLAGLLLAAPASAQETDTQEEPQQLAKVLAGPMPATVVRVVDGDTIQVNAQTWLGQTTSTLVRIRHVDTPELKGRCPQEKEKARAARDQVIAWAPIGSQVQLQNVETDKYGGRVIADIILANGKPLHEALIAAGFARPYEGKAREPWCNSAEIGPEKPPK